MAKVVRFLTVLLVLPIWSLPVQLYATEKASVCCCLEMVACYCEASPGQSDDDSCHCKVQPIPLDGPVTPVVIPTSPAHLPIPSYLTSLKIDPISLRSQAPLPPPISKTAPRSLPQLC